VGKKLTDDGDENTKVDNPWHSPTSGGKDNDEADGNQRHEEENEWRSLLATIRQPG